MSKIIFNPSEVAKSADVNSNFSGTWNGTLMDDDSIGNRHLTDDAVGAVAGHFWMTSDVVVQGASWYQHILNASDSVKGGLTIFQGGVKVPRAGDYLVSVTTTVTDVASTASADILAGFAFSASSNSAPDGPGSWQRGVRLFPFVGAVTMTKVVQLSANDVIYGFHYGGWNTLYRVAGGTGGDHSSLSVAYQGS